MLTKNLLRTRNKSGRVYPQFIKMDNAEALELAEQMCQIFTSSIGQSVSNIELELEDQVNVGSVYFQGFKKLLIDRCEWGDDREEIEDLRWKIISEGKRLRSENDFLSIEQFQIALSETLNLDILTIQKSMYEDLPENKSLKSMKSMIGEELIHRYNSALVQGLLIHANEIEIKLFDLDVATKRQIFRWIKFHQLLVEVNSQSMIESELIIKLSGPNSIFKNSQTYGLKLANFFPRLLHLKKWELNADILLNKKELQLKIDSSLKIKSHYKEQGSYIPEEFDVFIKNFNKNSKDWIAEVYGDFYHIGRQSYCFPDIVFSNNKGKTVYLELFHKWHQSQMVNRLDNLHKIETSSIILGVCRTIAKKDPLDKIVSDSKWFANRGFVFSDFPTYSAVNKILKQF